MFGCIMKIVLENAILLLVSHIFSSIFLASKQILYQKIHLYPHTNTHRKSTTTHTPAPTKIYHYPHKTHHHTTQKPPKHHHPHTNTHKKSTTIHTTQKPPKHHHPHHHNNNKKKSEIKERKIERLREREIDQEREIGLQRQRRLVLGGLRTRSKVNLYLLVHGWRSERWVLGVCGSVIGVSMFDPTREHDTNPTRVFLG